MSDTEKTKVENAAVKAEIDEIAKQAHDKLGSWCHRFDSVVDRLLHNGDTMRPKDVIRYAIEIADLAQAVIEAKKEEMKIVCLNA